MVIAVGLIALAIAAFIFGCQFRASVRHASVFSSAAHARAIALMLITYANDHGGVYPSGKSSTEVFQTLIDEGYASDSSVFWDNVLGPSNKIRPATKRLKPENVCWDITMPVDSTSPDNLPVVFSTGYQITYAPGGDAVPRGSGIGLEVCYKNMSLKFIQGDGRPDSIVPDVISRNFNPAGKNYLQLTPDGSLSQ